MRWAAHFRTSGFAPDRIGRLLLACGAGLGPGEGRRCCRRRLLLPLTQLLLAPQLLLLLLLLMLVLLQRQLLMLLLLFVLPLLHQQLLLLLLFVLLLLHQQLLLLLLLKQQELFVLPLLHRQLLLLMPLTQLPLRRSGALQALLPISRVALPLLLPVLLVLLVLLVVLVLVVLVVRGIGCCLLMLPVGGRASEGPAAPARGRATGIPWEPPLLCRSSPKSLQLYCDGRALHLHTRHSGAVVKQEDNICTQPAICDLRMGAPQRCGALAYALLECVR